MRGYLDLLRKPKATAAELREMIASLSVADAEAKVSALEGQRRKFLLAGDDAGVDRTEREIVAANRECERIATAIEELTTRIAAAEKSELDEELARRAAANRETWRNLRSAYLALHEAATAVAGALAEIEQHRGSLRAANTFFASHDRHELELNEPMEALRQQLSRAPGNLPDVRGFVLPGYGKHRHPDNLNFGNLKDVALQRA